MDEVRNIIIINKYNKLIVYAFLLCDLKDNALTAGHCCEGGVDGNAVMAGDLNHLVDDGTEQVRHDFLSSPTVCFYKKSCSMFPWLGEYSIPTTTVLPPLTTSVLLVWTDNSPSTSMTSVLSFLIQH